MSRHAFFALIFFLALPAPALADASVVVPAANGEYVYYGDPRNVTVDFGQPITDGPVEVLFIRWVGTGAQGLVTCGSEGPGAWPGYLRADVIGAGGIAFAEAAIPDGSYEIQRAFNSTVGFDFVVDGTFQMSVTFQDGPADCFEGMTYLQLPQCTITRTEVAVSTSAAAEGQSWGAIKKLYR